ncbi:MAG: hypothetical protein HC812_19105 [Leptolyngbya sp. RL_3_1]|nr:hypothetical protein [Leptolyngbya sp. RL_3_1]
MTANEVSSQSAAIHESGTNVTYIDDTATIESNLRLLMRIKRTREVSGKDQRFKLEHLDFSSTADQTFTAGQTTTPFTDAEADEVTLVGYTPWVNMDAIYTTAGDVAGA